MKNYTLAAVAGPSVDTAEANSATLTSVPMGASVTIDELVRENAVLRRRLSELEEFRTLAYKDALTGLWNRRYFDERLAEELDRARRVRDRQLSIMAIDVNDLKALNDSRGHGEGDRALRAVAAFLRSHLRAHDICCRIGGDEFALILPEVGPAGCQTLAARLRQQFGRGSGDDGVLNLGLSVGSASIGGAIAGADELMRAADRAMYRDKRRQKDRRCSRLPA